MKRFKKFIAGLATLLMITVQVPTDIAQIITTTTNVATHTLAPQLSPNMNLSPTAAQPAYGTTSSLSWDAQVKTVVTPFVKFAEGAKNLAWNPSCYLLLSQQYSKEGAIRAVRIDKEQRRLYTQKNKRTIPTNAFLDEMLSAGIAEGLEFDIYFVVPKTHPEAFLIKVNSPENTTSRYIRIDVNAGNPVVKELDAKGFAANLKAAHIKSIDESPETLVGLFKTKAQKRQERKDNIGKFFKYITSSQHLKFSVALLVGDVLVVSAIGMFASIAGGVTSLLAIGTIAYVAIQVAVVVLNPRVKHGIRMTSVLLTMMFLLSACTTLTGAAMPDSTTDTTTTITPPTTIEEVIELPAEFETEMTINFASSDTFEKATPFSQLGFFAAGQENFALDFSEESEYKIRIELPRAPANSFSFKIESGHLTYPELFQDQRLDFGDQTMIGGERFSHLVNLPPHLFQRGTNGKYYADVDLTDYPELGGTFYKIEFFANAQGDVVYDNQQVMGSTTPTVHIPEANANIADTANALVYWTREISHENPDFTEVKNGVTHYGFYFSNDEVYSYNIPESVPTNLVVTTQNKPASTVNFRVNSGHLLVPWNQNDGDFHYDTETGIVTEGAQRPGLDFAVKTNQFRQQADGTWQASVSIVLDTKYGHDIYSITTPATNIISYELKTQGNIYPFIAQTPTSGADAVRDTNGQFDPAAPISETNPGFGFVTNRPDLGLETQTQEGISNTVQYYRAQGVNLSTIESSFVWNDGTQLSLSNTNADYLWNNYGIPMYLRLETWNQADPTDRGFLINIQQQNAKYVREFRTFCQDAKSQNIPVYLAFNPEMNYTGDTFDKYPWQGDPTLYRAAVEVLHNIAVEEGADNIIFVLDVHAENTGRHWDYSARPYYSATIFDMVNLRGHMRDTGGYGNPSAQTRQFDDVFEASWDDIKAFAPNIPIIFNLSFPNEANAEQPHTFCAFKTQMQQNLDLYPTMIIITNEGEYSLLPESMDTLRAYNVSDNFGPLLENLTNRSWDTPGSIAEIVLPEGATYSLREVSPGAKTRFLSIANIAKSNAVNENIDVLLQALIIQSGLGVYDETYTETYRIIDQQIAAGLYNPRDIAGVLQEMNNRGFYGYDHISAIMMANLNTAITEGDVDSIDAAALMDADFKGIDQNSDIWKLLTANDEQDVMPILYKSYTEAFNAGTPYLGLKSQTKVSYDTFAAYAMPYAKNVMHNLTLLRALYQFPIAQNAGVALSYQSESLDLAS